MRLRSNTNRREDGFTLVEMLMSLVIVAILMAVVLPSFFSQKQNTKVNAAKDAASQLANAVSQFQNYKPVISTDESKDPLAVWFSTYGSSCGGIPSCTATINSSGSFMPDGATLIMSWPDNPLTTGARTPVKLIWSTTCTIPAGAYTAHYGDVFLCRPALSGSKLTASGATQVEVQQYALVNNVATRVFNQTES